MVTATVGGQHQLTEDFWLVAFCQVPLRHHAELVELRVLMDITRHTASGVIILQKRFDFSPKRMTT